MCGHPPRLPAWSRGSEQSSHTRAEVFAINPLGHPHDPSPTGIAHLESSAGQNAGLPSADLEFVNYGAGYAWLRRELDVAIADAEQLDQDLPRTLGWPEPQPRPEPDEARVALTDLGRRALAMERLFGPWPTLPQANAAEVPAPSPP